MELHDKPSVSQKQEKPIKIDRNKLEQMTKEQLIMVTLKFEPILQQIKQKIELVEEELDSYIFEVNTV